jgi:exonuclease III
MNRRPQAHERTAMKKVRIWQQNCRRSEACQQDVINSCNPERYDLILIQEPWMDHLKNTRAPTGWSTVYPPTHQLDGAERTRSVIFISPLLAGDACTTIPIDSPDVSAVQLETESGSIRVLNIYNPQEHPRVIKKLREWTDDPTGHTLPPTALFARGPAAHTLWMGDFNRHHPLWDDSENTQLFTNEALTDADVLIKAVMHAQLMMALPRNINTYETPHGSWTRPDNVFASEEILEQITRCDVAPELRPVLADHLPVITEIDVAVDRNRIAEAYAWKQVDEDTFRAALKTALLEKMGPAPERIDTVEQLERAAMLMDEAIQSVRNNPEIVPKVRMSPYSRRWWTPELSLLRAKHRNLRLRSHKRRHAPDDPVHAEARRIETQYKDAILKEKKQAWERFIAQARDWNSGVWIANRIISGTSTDGGKTRLPPLKEKRGEETHYARTDEEKAKVLHREFFPPPPAAAAEDHPPAPEPAGEDVEEMPEITEEQIRRAIKKLDRWKAVMADDIPNAVLQWCEDLLVEYLLPIYRATVALSHYPSNWKIYDTIVLRKPGKPDYALPKAHRPICLLKTIAKPLSILMTEYISDLAERYQLLPPTHFGFRPGRATTDALFAVEKFIQDAWAEDQVVTCIFLDVKGAFPSVHIDRLIQDLRRKGIPRSVTNWIQAKLRDRRTCMVFDGYRSPVPLAIRAGLDQGCPLSGILYNFYNAWIGELVSTQKPGRVLIPGFADDLALCAKAPTFAGTRYILRNLLNRENGVLDWARSHNCAFEKTKWAMVDHTHKSDPDPERPGRRKPRLGSRFRLDDGTILKPQLSTKYLGVMINYKLRWTEQWHEALARGTKWTMACARIMRSKLGLKVIYARQLVQAVCIPKMLYAAELWARPTRRRTGANAATREPTDRIPTGLIGKMQSVLRRALLAASGAMRGTPTDTIEAHLNILPLDLHLENVRHRAVLRLISLPQTHPLHRLVRDARDHPRKRHESALHALTRRYRTRPDLTEEINVVRSPPYWQPNFSVTTPGCLKKGREDAAADDAARAAAGETRVYSDGSAHDGGVGSAAHLIRPDGTTASLRLHLGSTAHYIRKSHRVYVVVRTSCRPVATLPGTAEVQPATSDPCVARNSRLYLHCTSVAPHTILENNTIFVYDYDTCIHKAARGGATECTAQTAAQGSRACLCARLCVERADGRSTTRRARARALANRVARMEAPCTAVQARRRPARKCRRRRRAGPRLARRLGLRATRRRERVGRDDADPPLLRAQAHVTQHAPSCAVGARDIQPMCEPRRVALSVRAAAMRTRACVRGRHGRLRRSASSRRGRRQVAYGGEHVEVERAEVGRRRP